MLVQRKRTSCKKLLKYLAIYEHPGTTPTILGVVPIVLNKTRAVVFGLHSCTDVVL